MESTIKIKLYGVGGQGIKLLVDLLGEYSAEILGKFTALTTDYDTVVRKGKVEGDLIISDRPIKSPLIDDADFCVIFNLPKRLIKAKRYYIDTELKNDPNFEEFSRSIAKSGVEYVDFSKEGTLPKNMVALGLMLRSVSEPGKLINDGNIKKLLGEKASLANIEAVKYGLDIDFSKRK